jgi:hypothetical protein
MTTRILILAAALSLASPGADAKGLLVRLPVAAGLGTNTYDQGYQYLLGILNQGGATYAQVNATGTRSLFVKTGVQTWGFNGSGGLGTEAFDWVGLYGYDRQTPPGNGLNVDSLTLRAGWPSVPVIFFLAPHNLASRLQQGANACTTAVRSDANPVSGRYDSYVMVGGSKPYKWNTKQHITYPAFYDGSTATRLLRQLISLQYSGATPHQDLVCDDCDSTGAWSSPSIDTLIAFMLSRSASEPAPLLFADAGGGTEDLTSSVLAAALARIDSVTNGKVFDKPGRQPIKIAIVVHHAVGRGDYRYNGQNSYPGSGGVMVSTLNDSANVKASLDSLNKLAVPITFLADPCSLAAYPSSKRWIYQVAKARVGLEVNAGIYNPGGGANAGNASRAYPADPFGHRRARLILPPGATGLPTNCSADTTSTYCELKNGFEILRAYFPSRVDPSIYPGAGDWSPLSHTRAALGPGPDSVLWAASNAGAQALLIEPITTDANVGISWDIVNGSIWGGATGPAAAPHGYFPDAGTWPIYKTPGGATSGGIVGRMKIVATRGAADGQTTQWAGQTHDCRGEFWCGLLTGNWYFAPLPYYYHSFYTRTPVWSINMSQLGGNGSAAPARYGWWQTKWLVNEMQFANSLMPPGKKLFDFVYLSEVDP